MGTRRRLPVLGGGDELRVFLDSGPRRLFLTGVFPDHAASHALGPLGAARLLRSGGLPPEDLERAVADGSGSVGLLDALGQRWYQLACAAAGPPLTEPMEVVAEVAERFGVARRVLNLVTDRYLYPVRTSWFGGSAA
ncbi:MAG: hypothetical protein M3203_09270 [Actinomycetota bacterium]|nr:hypothetical protein [Actinomycetota bacterium]